MYTCEFIVELGKKPASSVICTTLYTATTGVWRFGTLAGSHSEAASWLSCPFSSFRCCFWVRDHGSRQDAKLLNTCCGSVQSGANHWTGGFFAQLYYKLTGVHLGSGKWRSQSQHEWRSGELVTPSWPLLNQILSLYVCTTNLIGYHSLSITNTFHHLACSSLYVSRWLPSGRICKKVYMCRGRAWKLQCLSAYMFPFLFLFISTY